MPADPLLTCRRLVEEALRTTIVAYSARCPDRWQRWSARYETDPGELFYDHAASRNPVLDPRRLEAPPLVIEEDGLPPVAPLARSLTRTLLAPAEISEHAPDQLRWIATHWRGWLPVALREQIWLAVDELAEAHRPRGGGPGPVQAPAVDAPLPSSGATEQAPAENFSADHSWMGAAVLIAKQTFVWLHQLSERYGRTISRLDQIPDAELDELAGRGFDGLWLIGLWERSSASRDIKRRRGNPEAESSAYALDDYAIASALGGQDALDDLRERAGARGIRLAADMVPNHMGLDSQWLVDHPDWFIQLPEPPFPGYRFDGPDLSEKPELSVYLEDGYWDESDAAVVYKLVHHPTKSVRFVYHGNDGTQMPWNDTAQLDYLNPALREAVIQTILQIAKRFPIIRFDAAMTLATQHIQRLWYPPPGDGGAIASRSRARISPERFAEQLPGEFWRDVVDRLRVEAPGTLLIAEAFWMMESFFVRTLGLHRVYNSAFMHMLRDEDNAKYRQSIQRILAQRPEILARFANFMNNPDEDSARAQFGTGDKYFGIATLMATLPGLPMFGHGQVEGFAEKYGMEFRRAYQGEQPDQGLIDHHERMIFPLLRRRAQFSGVQDFALFDFLRPDGSVDEDVYAFCNRGPDGAASLVLFNNAHTATSGRISRSCPVNTGSEDAPSLRVQDIAEALALPEDATLRDPRCGISIRIQSAALSADLGPYQALVLYPHSPGSP